MTMTSGEQNEPAPARVRFAYDIRKGDSTQSRELPFVIGVLGDFCAAGVQCKRWEERPFQPVDLSTFEEALDALRPRLRLELSTPLIGNRLTADLAFHRLEDFQPAAITEQVDDLRKLQRSKSVADRKALGDYLDSILHAQEFQRLEAAWRGLWHLVSSLGQAEHVRIRLIDVSKEELLADLENTSEIGQTILCKKLYRDPYEAIGIDLFSLLVGDFAFTQEPNDMRLLSGIAAVASKCLAPFLAAAGPEMLNIKDFNWISNSRNIFRTGYQAGNPGPRPATRDVLVESPLWKSFRDSEDSRFVGLVLPRVLLREPYRSHAAGPDGFVYNETCDRAPCLLWGNPAFALARGIAEGFERNGWFDLPIANFNLTRELPARGNEFGFVEGEVATSLEVRIAEGADKALSVHGFVPLVMGKQGEALLFWAPSCHRPKVFDNPFATINAIMFSQLTYLLAGSRFMHCLKLIGRDANEHSRARLEHILNQWIAQNIHTNDELPESEMAQRPLRSGLVHLHEIPDNPESFRMVAFLLPRFGRLTELKIELRLATEISLPAAGN